MWLAGGATTSRLETQTMSDLLSARWQMALSLGFHILFAVSGMAMPLFLVLAERRYLKTREVIYRELAHRWAKGTAILFAVGAVSGTVLSFELGLLWPRFMAHAGPLIGMPFSLEGFAFFLEAIALGVYLYGWDRVSERVHWWSGVIVAVSGLVSGIFVVAVNAWMNTPRGFEVNAAGEFVNVDLMQAFFTPAFPTQALHMAVAAYASVSFAVLGIHAWGLLRHRHSRFHRAALGIVGPVAMLAAPLMIATGDGAAKHLAEFQPTKLAAAEALFETQAQAPLLVGGLPDSEARTVCCGLEIPSGLSLLAKGDPGAVVRGLDQAPRELWPPVLPTHLAFQLMVGCGFAMLGMAAWFAFTRYRKKELAGQTALLRALVVTSPLGLLAVEAGWCVTEIGRQPWIIQGVMKVEEALTPMPGLIVPLLATIAIYLFLGTVVAVLLYRFVLAAGDAQEPETTQERS